MNYDFLIDLEKQLHQTIFRKDTKFLESILHQDFFEFGSSGKKWDRATTIKSLSQEDIIEYHSSNYITHILSNDVVLITYETKLYEKIVLRSSIWKKDKENWKLFFHQGTKSD